MTINQGSSEEKRILSGLNDEQREAVCTTEGPLLVLAGAGTGKTLVITKRIAFLLHRGVPAQNVLAVTFTRKAALEMRQRVENLLGGSSTGVTIATFHALGLKILHEHGHRLDIFGSPAIYGTADQLKLIESILDEVDPEGVFSAINLLSRISRAKNRGVTPEDLLNRDNDEMTRRAVLVFSRYQSELRRRNALDLDDLLLLPLGLIRDHARVRNYYAQRWHYLLVDEYQDTNRSQSLLTQHLAGERRNLCVVGDDDQSIYRFRGAEVGNILRFQKECGGAKLVMLQMNYRCTAPIIEFANTIIEKARSRYPKRLVSHVGAGVPVRAFLAADASAETRFLVAEIKRIQERGTPWADIALLYRSKGEIRPVQEALHKASIPCERAEGGVTLTTLHQAKGLEYPYVFLPAVEEDILPHFHSLKEGEAAIEEERRLFYVGITRAKTQLIVSASASRNGHERIVSRFLREVNARGILVNE